MIKWSKRLYFGEKAERERSSLLLEIEKGYDRKDVQLLALPVNPQNLLEILPLAQLEQEYYQQQEIPVVGVALGKPEAMELVRRIIGEVYQEKGNCDVRAYLADSFEK